MRIRGRREARGRIAVVAAIGVTLAACLALAAQASAAAPEFVLQIPPGTVAPGEGAGELDWPNAIVGKPSGTNKGHIYIADQLNQRIAEYTAWGLFVRAWGWGVANGAAELQSCGPVEPEEAPPAGLCQAGGAGGGKGQLNRPVGMAIDPAGNIYVLERSNFRVQKFSSGGQFLVMFGGDVNKTKVEEGAPATERNRCPVAPTDVCQAGAEGTGSGSFGEHFFDSISYSPAEDAILVGDVGRIEEFNLDGTLKKEIPFDGALEAFEGKSVLGLDVDAAGDIYLSVGGLDNAYKLAPSGEPLEPGKPGGSKFAVENPSGVAVDQSGNVYATGRLLGKEAVVEFSATGERLVPTKEEEASGELFPNISGASVFGIATNICAGSEAPGSLYVAAFSDHVASLVDAYGSGPTGCEPPPPRPPVIVEQYATSVITDSARVQAKINPKFFKDATYFVEYGEGRCSEGGCDRRAPLEGVKLTEKVLNRAVPTERVVLSGLSPDRTYHYRFAAKSSGGGPVHGGESTLRTFALPSAPLSCPGNEAFRAGPSANLPDCRAYELVSPLNKEGGDAGFLPSTKIFFEVNQSADSGERFTYSSMTPFAEPESAPFISQYLAVRDPARGWSDRDISPPRTTRPGELQKSLNNDFKAFSGDLCTAWLRHNSASTLAPGAIPGFPNAYRRSNCASPAAYEALSTAPPLNLPADEYLLNPLGFSEDGSESFFVANAQLTEDAPALNPKNNGELSLYVHGPQGLRYVCILPSGTANPTPCGPGLPAGQPDGRSSAEQNAVSADGSRVFWTAYKGAFEVAPKGVPGGIYLRFNPAFEQGVCGEPEAACTVRISGEVSPEPAQFWGASRDGSKVIFKFTAGEVDDDLYEFDVEAKQARLIAGGVENPMGMSEDASRVYFVSSEVLAPGASPGAHNLYLYDSRNGGSFAFIMKLADTDVGGSELRPGAANEVPTERSANVSADGLHAAFTSAASPTPGGYDNRDAVSGLPDEEAYVYDASSGRLHCVSCNPTNARPAGVINDIGVVARLAPPKVPLQRPRTLSADGSRLFFESHEALVPQDTNSTWDVYEWEAPGAGSCTEALPGFRTAVGGCVSLISTGESAAESHFLDADPSGGNVFIATQSSLVASDSGSTDVYDARVGGGFPASQAKAPCEGAACQSPPPPPVGQTPASAVFEGAGNVKKAGKRCRRGSHRVRSHGKSRCVKKKKKKSGRHSKRAAHKRRAAR